MNNYLKQKCKHCQKEFKGLTEYSTYCSDECLRKANNYRNYPKKDERNSVSLAVSFISMAICLFSSIHLFQSDENKEAATTFLILSILGIIFAAIFRDSK